MTTNKPWKNPGVSRSNLMRMRHGLRGSKLPKGCRHIENRGHTLRRQLEDACLAARGEVRLTDAAIIQTACRWEQHGLLAARWLRMEGHEMSPSDRLRFSEAVAKASAERDRCIGKLDVHTVDRDAWETAIVPRITNGQDSQADHPSDTESCTTDDTTA